MKKIMTLFHIKKFSAMLLASFKKKTSICGSQVGHMWVRPGLFCESVGQMGQQVQPTFNPVPQYSIDVQLLVLNNNGCLLLYMVDT